MKISAIFTEFRVVFIIGLIILVTIIIAVIFKYFAERNIKKLVLSKHIDPTSYLFVKKLITALIYIIGFSFALVQIPEMKIVGHSLLAALEFYH